MKSDRSENPVWYGGLPSVAAVEPGSPAAAAGIMTGDQIIEVYGRLIVEADARKRFGAVKPGDKLRLTVLRHGTMEPVTITARTRSDRIGVASAASTRQTSRYSGVSGTSNVDVWSSVPVTVDVGSNGELIVRTETATIRVRPGKSAR